MPDNKKWLGLAKEAYDASSTYVDQNWRADWEYSLRAFRNEHAPGSKYASEDYKARSHLFRPKTRSIIRKNEAAAAVALFSNMDIVNLTPGNPDDVMNVASAAAMKEILEYRLSRTIPAFPLVMGAIQDAQTTGTVCSYQYWEYERTPDGRVKKDKPCIQLRPIENIRIDGGADWLDPVGTTPYLCDIVPMYVCDVRAMMNSVDDKTGKPKWKKYEEAVILRARPGTIDRTRLARLGKQKDPHDESTGIKAFDIVWVMRWFMRDDQGEDICFYTLGTEEMLTDAKSLEEVYFHGKRPYVIGYAILETHKALKTGLPMLVKPLQQEANDVANTRLDNVKFVLYKRWLVARGKQVDVQSLVRGVPGGVTLLTDPNNDVKESNWADVTSSAYVEQDRINADLDELAGNFSPSTKVANNAVNDTLGGSRMAAQGAGLMSDYLLRTVIETWWEPVLRQLVLIEQHYETDEVVLSVCANKARLFPRFGISRITDMMLMNEVNVNVNVGMGSSNPNDRFQKLVMGTEAVMRTIAQAPPNFNAQEFIKEAYSNMGYRDGARFWSTQADPRLLQAMKMVQQMQAALKGRQMELQAEGSIKQLQVQSNERIKAAELQVDEMRIQGDLRIREAEVVVEQAKLDLERLKAQIELKGATEQQQTKMIEMAADIEQAQLKLEGERTKLVALQQKAENELQQSALELQTAREAHQNETRIGEVADGVKSSMSGMSAEMERMKAALAKVDTLEANLHTMNKGLGAMAGMMMQPKRKAKGIKLRKKDGKRTDAVIIDYDDGQSEELAVGRG